MVSREAKEARRTSEVSREFEDIFQNLYWKLEDSSFSSEEEREADQNDHAQEQSLEKSKLVNIIQQINNLEAAAQDLRFVKHKMQHEMGTWSFDFSLYFSRGFEHGLMGIKENLSESKILRHESQVSEAREAYERGWQAAAKFRAKPQALVGETGIETTEKKGGSE